VWQLEMVVVGVVGCVAREGDRDGSGECGRGCGKGGAWCSH